MEILRSRYVLCAVCFSNSNFPDLSDVHWHNTKNRWRQKQAPRYVSRCSADPTGAPKVVSVSVIMQSSHRDIDVTRIPLFLLLLEHSL